MGCCGGAALIALAVVIMVLLAIISVISLIIFLITLGSSSEPKKFNMVPVFVLAADGLFAIILDSFQKNKIYEPFGESWIMQTPPTKLEQIP